MVRDTEVDEIAKEWKYDEGLGQRYTGQLKEWGEAQGISAELARSYWRAHWQLPSPTQAYQMLHRLRKGSQLEKLTGLHTSEATISKLLEIDDYPEYWRERLMAISHHPLTRVDSQRAYILGVLSEEDLISAFRDLGYTQQDAQTLTAFTKERRFQWLLRRPESKAYASGSMNSKELSRSLSTYKLTSEELERLLQQLSLSIQSKTRQACLKQYRRQLLTGIISEKSAEKELVKLGLDKRQSEVMIKGWLCEKASTPKAIPAGKLFQMAMRNSISDREYAEGLKRIGYDHEAITILLRDMAQERSERIKSKTSKRQKAAAREKELEQKKKDALERKRKAEAKRADRDVSREERAKARRLKAWSTAANKLAKAAGMTDGWALDVMNDAMIWLTDNFDFTEEENAAIAQDATKRYGISTDIEYLSVVVDLASSFNEYELDGESSE